MEHWPGVQRIRATVEGLTAYREVVRPTLEIPKGSDPFRVGPDPDVSPLWFEVRITLQSENARVLMTRQITETRDFELRAVHGAENLFRDLPKSSSRSRSRFRYFQRGVLAEVCG